MVRSFTYKPLRARLTMLFLLASLFATVLAVISASIEGAMFSDAIAGRLITDDEWSANDTRAQVIGLLQISIYSATAIVFLFWVFYAHRNLTILGARELKYTPVRAVMWFLIPIANLFMPYRVVCEIWQASSAEVDRAGGTSWKSAAITPVVGYWWWANILAILLSRSADSSYAAATTADGALAATRLYILSDMPSAVSAVALFILIKTIDQRQAEKAHRLAENLT